MILFMNQNYRMQRHINIESTICEDAIKQKKLRPFEEAVGVLTAQMLKYEGDTVFMVENQ